MHSVGILSGTHAIKRKIMKQQEKVRDEDGEKKKTKASTFLRNKNEKRKCKKVESHVSFRFPLKIFFICCVEIQCGMRLLKCGIPYFFNSFDE